MLGILRMDSQQYFYKKIKSTELKILDLDSENN